MQLNFSKTITQSDVPLWVLPSSNFGSVSAGVVVKCGTRDENWPKEAGITHALEHMHFQGTKKFPNSMKLTEYIEEIGGRINAWTNSDRTFYFTRVPASYAERAVNIISEQIKNSIFPEEKIPIEMKNIVQEIKRRNDNPRRYLWTLSNKAIYGNHPLAKDVLGTEESVSAFAKEDFLSFKQRYYDPSNFTFVIVGSISIDESSKLFNKYFPEKSKINSNKRPDEKAYIPENRELIENKEIEQLHISLSALIGASDNRSSLYLEFFSNMISGGMSFPLFQEIRDKRGLCYEIGSSVNRHNDVGRFDIYIGTDPKRYKEAINAIYEIIQKYKSDEGLLDKVKNLKIGRLMLDYENTGEIINTASTDIVFLGTPRGLEEIKKEIEEVNIENIKDSVDKYLSPELFFTTMLVPKGFKIG